jgi:NADH-ubiquinone oxidoreductase chain 1
MFSIIWGPSFFFIVIILVWFNLNHIFVFIRHKMRLFFLIILLGSSIYTALLTGIGSQSKFAYIGSIRISSQAIRYEICLSIFLFRLLILRKSFSISTFRFFCFFNFLIWFLFILSETNRAPFDFAEGERELIRGFNIEIGRVGFVLLFLGEYGIILGFSFLGSFLILPIPFFITFLFRFLIVLSRRTLPRFRYDFLIGFCWFFLLPLTILLLLFFVLI